MKSDTHPVHQSQLLKRMLNKMPTEVAESFTEEQLIALNKAVGGFSWARHKVDLRGTISIWRSSYYFVILWGRNRRELSRFEKQLGQLSVAFIITLFLLGSALLGLLLLCLLKSAMGVDLFPNFSLGIWTWFKANVL